MLRDVYRSQPDWTSCVWMNIGRVTGLIIGTATPGHGLDPSDS